MPRTRRDCFLSSITVSWCSWTNWDTTSERRWVTFEESNQCNVNCPCCFTVVKSIIWEYVLCFGFTIMLCMFFRSNMPWAHVMPIEHCWEHFLLFHIELTMPKWTNCRQEHNSKVETQNQYKVPGHLLSEGPNPATVAPRLFLRKKWPCRNARTGERATGA